MPLHNYVTCVCMRKRGREREKERVGVGMGGMCMCVSARKYVCMSDSKCTECEWQCEWQCVRVCVCECECVCVCEREREREREREERGEKRGERERERERVLCVHGWVSVCVCVSVCACAHACVRACVCSGWVRVRVCACECVHVCTCMHVCEHQNMHRRNSARYMRCTQCVTIQQHHITFTTDIKPLHSETMQKTKLGCTGWTDLIVAKKAEGVGGGWGGMLQLIHNHKITEHTLEPCNTQALGKPMYTVTPPPLIPFTTAVQQANESLSNYRLFNLHSPDIIYTSLA